MAKQTKTSKLPQFRELKNTFKYFPFVNQKQPIIVLILIGLIFYCTSLENEYALDDGIIIHQNDHVIKGFKGISDILTKDAYESFYRKMNATDQLAGGRYRPLSVVSFAIEQEFIGKYKDGNYTQNCWDQNQNKVGDPEEDLNEDGVFNEVDCQVKGAFLRHFNNMWTYVLGCIFLYLVFRNYMFRDNQDMAFLCALIFLCHPMHTEAIANVKSRDEIFSLIFVSLTFLFSFRYLDDRKPTTLFWASFMFLLALLSKEYAVVLMGLIPLAMYIFIKNEFDLLKFIKHAAIFFAILGVGAVLILKSASLGDSAKTLGRIAGLGIIAGGMYTFFKRFSDYKNVFLVLLVFIACFGIMIYIKYDFDITAKPGQKPTKSFWMFPFLYAILGIFVVGKTNNQKNFHTLMSWYYFVMLFYLAMRLVAVKLKPGVPDTEILNNPYLLADGQERFCTKAYVLLKYFTLLWFPHPLSSDYSYNTIIYRHFTDWDFILSIVLHLALVYVCIKLILKKHVLGFAIAVYIAFLLMIGNVLMDIGATMGERLLFHSSIGFAIALGWLILKGMDKLQSVNLNLKRTVLLGSLCVVVFLYGCKTWERNWDWKNDITLFIKDANTMPNSVLVLGNAGARWIDLADTKYFTKKPGENANLPFSSYKDEMLEFKVTDKELVDGVNMDKNGLPNDKIIEPYQGAGEFKNEQNLTMRQRSLYKGIGYLKHATNLHPRYVNGYLNLGLAYYKLKRDREALYYWKHAEKLYPNNPYLKNYYIVFYNELLQRGYQKASRGRSDSAAYELNKCIVLDRLNPEGWYNLGGAYYNLGHYKKAKQCWQEALRLNPNHPQAKQGMQTLTPQMLGEAPAVTLAPNGIKN